MLRRSFVLKQIILPQALRVIIPPLGNSVNGLLKTTAITSVISMEELLRRGQILMQQRIEAFFGRAYEPVRARQLARDDH